MFNSNFNNLEINNNVTIINFLYVLFGNKRMLSSAQLT